MISYCRLAKWIYHSKSQSVVLNGKTVRGLTVYCVDAFTTWQHNAGWHSASIIKNWENLKTRKVCTKTDLLPVADKVRKPVADGGVAAENQATDKADDLTQSAVWLVGCVVVQGQRHGEARQLTLFHLWMSKKHLLHLKFTICHNTLCLC